MRIAHLADLHLGYSAFGRTDERGINQREVDVVRACEEAFNRVAALQPDLILMAGDIFHKVRPSNAIITKAFKELSRLRGQVKAPIVMVAGNHEIPRSIEAGCILRLFGHIRDVHVADVRETAFPFFELGTLVTCLPYAALGRMDTIKLSPDPSYRYNILMLHGTVEGVLKQDCDQLVLRRDELLDAGWDYIACGHYHTYTRLAANAYYAGSTERTSNNIWAESREEKGFIEYDLENRRATFHPLTTRPVVDLPPIDGSHLAEGKELDALVAGHVARVPGSLDGKIVRQVVENFPRSMRKQIDYAKIRSYRSQALYFDLRLRSALPETMAVTQAERGTFRSLRQEVEEYLHRVPLEKGLERDLLVKLGLQYLDAVLQPEEGADVGETASGVRRPASGERVPSSDLPTISKAQA